MLRDVLNGTVLALLVAHTFLPPRLRRMRMVVVALVTAAALLGYTNFGGFRSSRPSRPQFVHYLEQMHYHLGSKYFAELGYDGLYVASVAAQRESRPERELEPFVRDLRRRLRGESTGAGNPHLQEVVRRFTPERWRSFVSDHDRFLAVLGASELRMFRQDHGYNATPTWTFVAQRIAGGLESSPRNLALLGTLDLLLLAGVLLAVFRTFGAWTGCLAAAVLGLGYGWHVKWIGGAFLRFDWLAALVFALCLLERKRFVPAGALLGYAVLARLFPAAFLMGPAVLALRGLLRRERPAWLVPLATGLGCALLLGGLAGCFAGRGASAWPQFVDRIALHGETWGRNHVGLQGAVLFAPQLPEALRGDLRLSELDQSELEALREERRWPSRIAAAFLLLLAAAAQWRSGLASAAGLGVLAVYALQPLSCYYWSLLVVLVLRRGPAGSLAGIGVVALSAGVYALAAREGEMVRALPYVLMSTGLLPILVGWAVPALRGEPEAIRKGYASAT